MEQKTIGSFIAVLRKANGMTQKQLAEKLCVSDKTVSRWERNETTPDLSLIPVIAEIFNITSDELLRGERKVLPAALLSPEVGSEKQLQRILTATKTKYTSRIILAVLIAVVSWIVSIGCSRASIQEAAVVCSLVGALIGIVFQIISAITAFSSINSEDFSGSQVVELKRRIVNSTKFISSSIAVFAAITLPGVVLYDVVEGLILGSIWGIVTVAATFGLSVLITRILITHGHEYLDT